MGCISFLLCLIFLHQQSPLLSALHSRQRPSKFISQWMKREKNTEIKTDNGTAAESDLVSVVRASEFHKELFRLVVVIMETEANFSPLFLWKLIGRSCANP